LICLLLAVLYLSDCLWVVPWNSVVIERLPTGGRWRLRTPGEWAAGAKRALMALVPLSGGTAFQVDEIPISMSPEGLAAWSSSAWSPKGRPPHPGWSIGWRKIVTIRTNDSDLVVNGRLLHHFPSRRSAAAWAGLVETVRTAAREDREQILGGFFHSRADVDEVRGRIEQIRSSTRWLRVAGAAQWILMFVAIPVILSRLGGIVVLSVLAGILFAFAIGNAWLFVRAHHRLCPDERWKRTESTVLMLLSWPMAARASDLVTRHCLSSFDPVTVALALPGAVGRTRFIDRVIRDANHPLDMSGLTPETHDICRWHMTWSLERTFDHLRKHDHPVTDPGDLPEIRAHDGAYCPRCLSLFGGESSVCSDCPGVPLQRVDQPKGG
jgi:hypothetical protein